MAQEETHVELDPSFNGGLYRIVPKAALEEEIGVSNLEGRTINALARMLTAPVAMVRTSRPPRKK